MTFHSGSSVLGQNSSSLPELRKMICFSYCYLLVCLVAFGCADECTSGCTHSIWSQLPSIFCYWCCHYKNKRWWCAGPPQKLSQRNESSPLSLKTTLTWKYNMKTAYVLCRLVKYDISLNIQSFVRSFSIHLCIFHNWKSHLNTSESKAKIYIRKNVADPAQLSRTN